MRLRTRRLPREPAPPETAMCGVCHDLFDTVELFDEHRESGTCAPQPMRTSPPVLSKPRPKTFAPNAINLTHLSK